MIQSEKKLSIFYLYLLLQLGNILRFTPTASAERISPLDLERCSIEFAELIANPKTFKKLPKNYWTKQTVAYWIQILQVKKIDLKQTSLSKLKKNDFEKIGITISPISLIMAGKNYFGSWEKALIYAGIDSDQFKKSRKWTKDKIIHEIKKLYISGVELSAEKLQSSKETFIAEYDGQTFTPYALFGAGVKFFGSWKNAVEAAGLTYKNITRVQQISWNRKKIIQSIQTLQNQGLPLHSKYLSKSSDKKMVLNGEQFSLQALEFAGRRHFGSWRQAIEAADLKYEAIVIRSKKWSNEDVLYEIKKVFEAGIFIHVKNMQDNKINFIIESNQKIYTLRSLFIAAKKYFGSWKKAVDATGIDYDKITLRQPSKAHQLYAEPSQRVWEDYGDGTGRYVSYLGETAETPEQILTKKDAEKNLGLKIKKMSGKAGEYIDGLLAYMEDHENLSNLTEVAAFLNDYYKKQFSKNDIMQILKEMRENPDLLNLLQQL